MAEHNVVTAILTHLREYGVNSRVIVVVPDKNRIKDAETGVFYGKSGLFGQSGSIFSGKPEDGQITHFEGGTVQVDTIHDVPRKVMQGNRFSMVVFDNVPDDPHINHLKQDVLSRLNIIPMEWITSTDGKYENKGMAENRSRSA